MFWLTIPLGLWTQIIIPTRFRIDTLVSKSWELLSSDHHHHHHLLLLLLLHLLLLLLVLWWALSNIHIVVLIVLEPCAYTVWISCYHVTKFHVRSIKPCEGISHVYYDQEGYQFLHPPTPPRTPKTPPNRLQHRLYRSHHVKASQRNIRYPEKNGR